MPGAGDKKNKTVGAFAKTERSSGKQSTKIEDVGLGSPNSRSEFDPEDATNGSI